jgi:hypothetical protein
MRFKSFIAASALLLLAPVSARSADGHIRLFFDPNQCRGEIPCGESRNLYVYAELEGATAGGITGLEFGMQIGNDSAADPGWSFYEEFSPGITVTLGSGAFGPGDQLVITPRRNRGRGVNLAWGECQGGINGLVLLETVQITNVGCTGAELRVITTGHDLPSNQFFLCPLAVLCDAPAFSKVCLGSTVTPCINPEGPRGDPALCSLSGEAVVNPAANSQSPCRVTAVTPSSWSGVKGLYRD